MRADERLGCGSKGKVLLQKNSPDGCEAHQELNWLSLNFVTFNIKRLTMTEAMSGFSFWELRPSPRSRDGSKGSAAVQGEDSGDTKVGGSDWSDKAFQEGLESEG